MTKATLLGIKVALNNNDYKGLSDIMELVTLETSRVEFAAITEISQEGIEKVFVSNPQLYPKEAILNPDENLFLLRKEKITTEFFEGFVVLAISKSSIDNVIFEINYPAFIYLGILMMLSLGVFYALATRIANPISYLTDISNQLKTGKYDLDINLVSSISEISDLNFSLIELQKALKKAQIQNENFNRQLEEQIIIRTKDLEKTNNKLIEAQNVSNLGNFEIDLKTGKWDCSSIIGGFFNIPDTFPRDNNSWKQLLSKENEQAMVNLFDKSISLNQKFIKDFKIIPFNSTGDEKWITVNASPVKDNDLDQIYLRGTIQNITDRKAIEKEVEKLSLVAKRTSNCVVITDLELKIQWVNDSFTKISGYSLDELKGKTPKMFQFETTDPAISNYIREEVLKGNDVVTEVLNRGKYGNEYWLQLSVGALKEDSGEITGYMAVEIDITELKNKDKKIFRQVELQNILIEISSTYINFDINHIDGTINSALEKLAHFVDADRAYIFDYNFHEGTTSNTHEWCALGIEPELDNLQGISLEYLQDWLEKHIKGLPLVVPEVALLPIAENGETNLRSILEPQGIQSLITIPFSDLGELIGFLGFDSVRIKRDFADEEIKLLTLFGQMLINVRQKQKAQKQLQIQEEKYRNIIANMNIGFLEVDGEDVIQSANQSFSSMTGFSLNELVGQKGIDMFFGNNDDSKKSMLERNSSRKEGKTDVYEMEVVTKSGEIKHWIISGGPNYNDSGEFVGSIGLHLDITDQKKLENEQLVLLNLTQNQNDRLKNFAYIVSHNLRSHAANLSGMTSFMEIQSKEFIENLFFQNFKNVIDNLMDSIHNLSQVSEIQTNDRTVMERVDLIEILNSSLLNVSSIALTSEVSIDFPQKNESIPVLGNPIYLESITLNLLTNAIKYRDSKKSCEIKILIQVKGETVELQVIDNGLGIDLKRQGRKIFGMYKTFHDHPDARGIGLFITKNQVEALGGKIEVDSEEGKGSVFKVSLIKFKYEK